jgi:hypothetical protein
MIYKVNWNYLPATARVVYVMIHEVEKPPFHWQNAFVGERRQAIEVTQDGYSFMIDNNDGMGWAKLLRGGGPDSDSKHLLACTILEECPQNQIILKQIIERTREYNEQYHVWFKKKDPTAYGRYCARIYAQSIGIIKK